MRNSPIGMRNCLNRELFVAVLLMTLSSTPERSCAQGRSHDVLVVDIDLDNPVQMAPGLVVTLKSTKSDTGFYEGSYEVSLPDKHDTLRFLPDKITFMSMNKGGDCWDKEVKFLIYKGSMYVANLQRIRTGRAVNNGLSDGPGDLRLTLHRVSVQNEALSDTILYSHDFVFPAQGWPRISGYCQFFDVERLVTHEVERLGG